MRLVRTYPHRWGEGKVHIARFQKGNQTDVTLCNTLGVHGELVEGQVEDVTCKKCLASKE